jgi:ABC-type multidrug transport system ATPase subunit
MKNIPSNSSTVLVGIEFQSEAMPGRLIRKNKANNVRPKNLVIFFLIIILQLYSLFFYNILRFNGKEFLRNFKMNTENLIVELQNVCFADGSGRLIFDNMNFCLKQGETALITGSVGKGKTSLIEILIGSRKPSSGLVYVFGKKISKKDKKTINENRKRIGGIGGIFRPISYQTVYENMKYPLLFKGDGGKKQKTRIIKGLSLYNLLGKKNKKVSELSRGEKMLLMFARATVADQPLLLIDEPLAGLDPETSGSIADMLIKLSVAGHSMIILTSGQTGLQIPKAIHYTIMNGQII